MFLRWGFFLTPPALYKERGMTEWDAVDYYYSSGVYIKNLFSLFLFLFHGF